MKSFIVLFLTLLIVVPISAQDSDDIALTPRQIMELGRGTVETLDWHPDGDVLAVGGTTGIWFYNESLDNLAHFDVTGEIMRLVWSSSNMLATLNRSGKLEVWAVTFEPYTLSLEQSWTFDDIDDYYAWYFAWSPDCETIAVVTSKGAQILDVRTGKQLLSIPDIDYQITWHPDGTQLAGAVDLGEDQGEQVRVWDAVTGDVVATYISPEPYLFWSDIQWSPDGSVIVGVTSVPGTVHAWDVATGNLLNELDEYLAEYTAIFDMWWSEDGQQLFTISRYVSDSSWTNLSAWETDNWTSPDEGKNLGDVWKIVKHPKANIWTFLTYNSQIMMWSMDEYAVLHVQSDHTQSAKMLEWSPDSQQLASANTLSEAVHVWTMSDSAEMQSITRPHQWLDMKNINWTKDGEALRGVLEHYMFTAPGTQVTGFVVELNVEDESAEIIHETSGHIPHDWSDSYLPFNIWSDDFKRVATILEDEPITLSTVTTSENGGLYINEVISTVDNSDYVLKLVWSPDNSMIAFIVRDQEGETSAWVYSAETGELIHRLSPNLLGTLYDITWSPDSTMVALVGNRIIAGSGETEYCLDIFKIDPFNVDEEHIVSIFDMDATFHHTWHPNNQAIAVNVSSGINIYPIKDTPVGVHPDVIATIPDVNVSALAWSPDGNWLAGSHSDGKIRIWDVVTHSE